LSGASPTVLVDGSNVRRSLWPNLSPERLVELCCAWAAANGVRAVVVFDGPAPKAEADERACSVVGSGGESADDLLKRLAGAERAEGREFWLVTSDRELRDDAGQGAARIVGGGGFARELTGESR
jgi:predicted RNA-binding protein with PIN domain